MSKARRDRERSAAADAATAHLMAEWGATGAVPAVPREKAVAVPRATLREIGTSLASGDPAWDPAIEAEAGCGPVAAWHYRLEPLTRWPVPDGATFEETFGKGSSLCIGPGDGAWCLELEMVERLRYSGWEAGWLNPWRIRDPRRRFPAGWAERMWTLDDAIRSLPDRLGALDGVFTREWVLDHGGAPDVVAAKPCEGRWVLLEGKATGRSRDKVKCVQVDWLAQARRLGLEADDFAVVSALVVDA